MARGRNPNKRGTRWWGPQSGTTFFTQPSGVTIDNTGIAVNAGNISVLELSYLDGAGGDVVASDAGTGMSLTGASVAWAGTTLQVSHGFSVLQGITAIFSGPTAATGTSPINCHIIQSTGGDANSTVSVVALTTFNSGASTKLHDGGATIFWTAFGI